MNAMGPAARRAGRRLLCSPAAMFVAVLTAGMGATSAAQHLGLYCAKGAASRHSNVVLACTRSSATRAEHARANGQKSTQTSPSTASDSSADMPVATADGSGSGAAGQAAWMDKNSGKKPGDGGLKVPLPDFSAPELSRFISPL